VNDAVLTDERRVLDDADRVADGAVKLSLGRKRHVLVRVA
jgi:tyrosyl-tRNA synthetase